MKEIKSREASALMAMGFHADEGGFAKASVGDVELRLDKVGSGWRCSCSGKAMRGGGCVIRIASWRSNSPVEAVLLCTALAKDVIARRQEKYEAEAERLRAMEDAIATMKEKADGMNNN